MKHLASALLVVAMAFSMSCKKQVAADFSTPEGAILKLEEAYRNKDIDAAVAAKDFTLEAKVMLVRLRKGIEADAGILKKTAEVLELAFRAEMRQKGFPNFNGLTSAFPRTEKYKDVDHVVVVTEVCTFPDGGTSTQKLLVAQTANGWRVLNVLE